MRSEEETPNKKPKVLEKNYDLIVLGNDPAGLFCAWAAAKDGCSVLVLDSHLSGAICPEWAPKKPCEEMLEVLSSRITQKNLFVQSTKSVVYHFRDGRKQKFPFLGSSYNRSTLNQNLRHQAELAGVMFLRGSYFRDLNSDELKIDFAGETYSLHPKCIVAADGLRSPIRSALGTKPQDFFAVLQYQVRLKQKLDTVHFWGESDLENGLGWFIPRGEMANIGFGVFKHVAHVLMFKLHQRLDDLMEEGWIESDDLSQKQGGLIPLQGPVLPPGKDGIFLLGDAAGLRDPIAPGIGIGLAMGCIGGTLAGQFIAEEIRKGHTPRINGFLSTLKPLVDNRLKIQTSAEWQRMENKLSTNYPTSA